MKNFARYHYRYAKKVIFYVNGDDNYLYKDVDCTKKVSNAEFSKSVKNLEVLLFDGNRYFRPYSFVLSDYTYGTIKTFSKTYYTGEYEGPDLTSNIVGIGAVGYMII